MSNATDRPDPPQPHRLRRKRRILFSIVSLLLLMLFLESVARVYLSRFDRGVLLSPDKIIYGFYPELKSVTLEREQRASSDSIELLFLGGSVLNAEWSSIQALVAERLAAELKRPVRIYNLAEAAHTSRDSLLKYERVGPDRFDLVVVYHGINEVRTNNAPPTVFRDDYGHYSWYRFVNAIDRDRMLPAVALPYFVTHAWIRLQDRLGRSEIVSTSEPREEWLKHGLDAKSARPFRDNLSRIIELARRRGEPVLLMTFASHLAQGYSDEAFAAMELTYTRHRSPLRWWGSEEGVVAGLAAHNHVVRELARSRDTLFVDQAALIPGESRNFDDICHLTVAGSGLFVDNMMPALRAALVSGPHRPTP